MDKNNHNSDDCNSDQVTTALDLSEYNYSNLQFRRRGTIDDGATATTQEIGTIC